MSDTNDNRAARTLADRIISGAVENAAPHPEVRDLIEHSVRNSVRLTDDGGFEVLDMNGNARLSNRPGYPPMTLEELLDEYKATRPTLFQSSTAEPKPDGRSAAAGEANPFKKGPGFSITQQMILLSKDPARAARLQTEAGR